jgi:hypothetical protein
MRGTTKQSRTEWFGVLIVAGFFISSMLQTACAVPAARPSISGGTIKTADGQLLRGCHAHILRDVNSTQSRFFTIRANVQRLKDEAHMNVIRICFITPGWGGASSPDLGIPIADPLSQIVKRSAAFTRSLIITARLSPAYGT